MKEDFDTAPKFVTDAMVDQYSIAGTVEEVIDKLESLIKTGINHFGLGGAWGPDREWAKNAIKEKI